jgi:hypothetical protein
MAREEQEQTPMDAAQRRLRAVSAHLRPPRGPASPPTPPPPSTPTVRPCFSHATVDTPVGWGHCNFRWVPTSSKGPLSLSPIFVPRWWSQWCWRDGFASGSRRTRTTHLLIIWLRPLFSFIRPSVWSSVPVETDRSHSLVP